MEFEKLDRLLKWKRTIFAVISIAMFSCIFLAVSFPSNPEKSATFSAKSSHAPQLLAGTQKDAQALSLISSRPVAFATSLVVAAAIITALIIVFRFTLLDQTATEDIAIVEDQKPELVSVNQNMYPSIAATCFILLAVIVGALIVMGKRKRDLGYIFSSPFEDLVPQTLNLDDADLSYIRLQLGVDEKGNYVLGATMSTNDSFTEFKLFPCKPNDPNLLNLFNRSIGKRIKGGPNEIDTHKLTVFLGKIQLPEEMEFKIFVKPIYSRDFHFLTDLNGKHKIVTFKTDTTSLRKSKIPESKPLSVDEEKTAQYQILRSHEEGSEDLLVFDQNEEGNDTQ